jgi:hypothetical protein
MRRHRPTNTARITLGGKVYSLGRWKSREAHERFDTLTAAWIASGRTSVDAALAVIGRHRAPAPPPAAPAATHERHAAPLPRSRRDATGGLTVGELALRWMEDIKANTPNYRRTSKWTGALAATPVHAFGSRALVDVQRHLVALVIEPPRRKDDDGPPPPPKRLSRRYINDVIARVRQMFNWGVLQELVPDDRVKALEIVPALEKGQTKAPDKPARKPVRPSIVRGSRG